MTDKKRDWFSLAVLAAAFGIALTLTIGLTLSRDRISDTETRYRNVIKRIEAKERAGDRLAAENRVLKETIIQVRERTVVVTVPVPMQQPPPTTTTTRPTPVVPTTPTTPTTATTTTVLPTPTTVAPVPTTPTTPPRPPLPLCPVQVCGEGEGSAVQDWLVIAPLFPLGLLLSLRRR